MNYNMFDLENSKFAGLLSLAEAAEIWQTDESTIRKAIAQGRLIDGRDCRKFGKQWVITADGMTNCFGRAKGRSIWSDYLYRIKNTGTPVLV